MDLVTNPGNYRLPPRLTLSQELSRSREEDAGAGSKQSAKKGEPWTEEEHLNFLQGLQALGKGQWKQIARIYVPTRTATQVASHAQKHFLRMAGSTKRRSRFSAVEEATLASAVPGALLPPPMLPAGAVEGRPAMSVALGVPVGHAPWLPPPVRQHGADLPIYPVGPTHWGGGRASPLSSKDSRGTASPLSSECSPPQQQPQQAAVGAGEARGTTAAVAANGATPLYVPRPLPPPTSRQQQLFKLLELREQMQAASTYNGGPPALAGPIPAPPYPTPTPLHLPPGLGAVAMPPRLAAPALSASALPRSAAPPAPAGTLRASLGVPLHAAASVHASPIKREPEELQQPAGKVPRLMPPLWGSVPGGLAMLAEAAACSDKGGGGAAGGGGKAPPQEGEADSDADTTLGHSPERHTV